MYVRKNYGHCTVIFYGCDSPWIKDQEHARRCFVPLSCFVNISNDASNPYLQDKYFTLKENKAELVKYLYSKFRDAGIDVIECNVDADCMIANKTLLAAQKQEGPTAVVVDDTDVIVMLLHH